MVLVVTGCVIGCIWWLVGGNTAGWITTLVAAVGLIVADGAADAEGAFSRSSPLTQRVVLLVALGVAVAGSVAYVIWPGTLGWYLLGVFALPVVFILYWGRSESGDDATNSPDFSDGPWTAP